MRPSPSVGFPLQPAIFNTEGTEAWPCLGFCVKSFLSRFLERAFPQQAASPRKRLRRNEGVGAGPFSCFCGLLRPSPPPLPPWEVYYPAARFFPSRRLGSRPFPPLFSRLVPGALPTWGRSVSTSGGISSGVPRSPGRGSIEFPCLTTHWELPKICI